VPGAYGDLRIELLNYDEDMLRSGLPIHEGVAEVAVVEPVTHDLRRLVLRLVDPPRMRFFAGQYVDVFIPGTREHRSFSMAAPPSRADHLEFLIKVYPDGRFSQLLEHKLRVGDRLAVKGPYGMFTLREDRDARLVFLGGGAGMAPILCLLRFMAERGIARPAVYYYGARTRRDLCYLDELRGLEERLPGFRFVPALSEPTAQERWDGEVGFVTDVADRCEGDLSEVDAYVCGPPPMVEAAIPMLLRHGVPENRIYFDKFTTTGSPADEHTWSA
jgi:propane monooxygenase reductase subunit